MEKVKIAKEQLEQALAAIKEEPQDSPDDQSEVEVPQTERQIERKKQRLSLKDYSELRRLNEERPIVPVVQETQASPSVETTNISSIYERPVTYNPRDPRCRVAAVSASADFLPLNKRQAFLEGNISAEDLLQDAPLHAGPSSQLLRDIGEHVGEMHKMLTKPSETFEASLSQVYSEATTLREEQRRQQRSPLIVKNLNSMMMTQSSVENVRETFKSQPYQNIPRSAQKVARQFGINLEEISNQMQTQVHEAPSPPSLSVDHDMQIPALLVAPIQKRFEDKGIQTTQNHGFFSITLDPKTLTKDQRKALKDFKEALGIKDEGTSQAAQERLQHRRANAAIAQKSNGSQSNASYDNDRAGPSSVQNSSQQSRLSINSVYSGYDEPRLRSNSYSTDRKYEAETRGPPSPKRNKSKYANAFPK